jgi:hypothetical protein
VYFVIYFTIQSLALVFATYFYAALFHTNIYWFFPPIARLAGGRLDWVMLASFTLVSLFFYVGRSGVPTTTGQYFSLVILAGVVGLVNLMVFFFLMLVFIGEGM